MKPGFLFSTRLEFVELEQANPPLPAPRVEKVCPGARSSPAPALVLLPVRSLGENVEVLGFGINIEAGVSLDMRVDDGDKLRGEREGTRRSTTCVFSGGSAFGTRVTHLSSSVTQTFLHIFRIRKVSPVPNEIFLQKKNHIQKQKVGQVHIGIFSRARGHIQCPAKGHPLGYQPHRSAGTLRGHLPATGSSSGTDDTRCQSTGATKSSPSSSNTA
jgi:hypothetical protein